MFHLHITGMSLCHIESGIPDRFAGITLFPLSRSMSGGTYKRAVVSGINVFHVG